MRYQKEIRRNDVSYNVSKLELAKRSLSRNSNGVMNHVGLLGHLRVKAKINIKIQLANLNNLATSFVELMFGRM